MKYFRSIILGLTIGIGFISEAVADRIAVLVHGYLGDAGSWHQPGVSPLLERAGWRAGGHWQSTPSGVKLVPGVTRPIGELMYLTTGLPSTAPLREQARFLGGMLLATSKRYPNTPIDLIGHSAGGVVSRLALVTYGAGNVERLITIAAPHLGTERAWQAMEATDDRGLFGKVKRWFVKRKVGEDVYRTVQGSRGALVDLSPPVPGTMLFWLNNQKHPNITYVSIVRGAAFGFAGDQVVPAPSQDMNRVPALAGKAQTLVVASGHLLTARDGQLLAEMLAKPKTSGPLRAKM